MRILAACLNYIGHASGIQGLLQHAAPRGHDYSYLMGGDPSPALSRLLAGVRITSLPFPPETLDFVTIYRDPVALKELMTSVVQEFTWIDDIADVMQKERADLVITDATSIWAVLAAAKARIPCINIPAGYAPFFTTRSGPEFDIAATLKDRRDEVFKTYGLPPHEWVQNYVASPVLNLIMSTPEFVGQGPTRVPFRHAFVGPLLCESFEALAAKPVPDDLPKKPFVFVCFGTLATGPLCERVITLIDEACSRLDIPCVIAAGNLQLKKRLSAQVYGYVPQLAMLRRSAVFVNVGGMNSVGESILAGVPMLSLPMYLDQIDSAILVKRSGVGELIYPDQATVENIQTALESLLQQSRFKQRITEVRESYQKAGGAELAFQLIEQSVNNPGH